MLQVEINKSGNEICNETETKKLHLLQIVKHVQELKKFSKEFPEIDYLVKMIEVSAKENVLFYDYKYI